jgi:hypothetical protein
MKEGIENIKVCIGFVLDLTEDVQTALADGKFNVKDSILFVGDIPQIPKAVRSAGKFWDELQDMDETEINEIIQFVVDRVKCDSEKAKQIIAKSFKTAISISHVVNDGIELAKTIKAA